MRRIIIAIIAALFITACNLDGAQAVEPGKQVPFDRHFVVPNGWVGQVNMTDANDQVHIGIIEAGEYDIRKDIVYKGGEIWVYPTRNLDHALNEARSHIGRVLAAKPDTKIDVSPVPYEWLIKTGSGWQPPTPSQPAQQNASATCGQAKQLGPWANWTDIDVDARQGVVHLSLWFPGKSPADTEYSVVVTGIRIKLRAAGNGWQWVGCGDRVFAVGDSVQHANRRFAESRLTTVVPIEKVNGLFPDANVQIVP